jgi:cytosine deaminase
MKYDLLIRNARLRLGRTCDIGVVKGRIETISRRVDESADQVLDAQSNLTTEPFVIAHLHLDKIMTGSYADQSALTEYHGGSMAGAMTAVEIASKVKEHYVESEIIERVNNLLTDAEYYGVSHMRALADVDTAAQLVGIKALLEIRKRFEDRIDVQVAAFPEDGIVRDTGTEELLYKAMDLGADVIAGHPWIEYTKEESRRHIDIVFEIARKYDADVTVMTDDAGDADLRTTEYLASSAFRNGWIGRASALHARATSLYTEVYHRKVTALLKKADVGIITNPHTGPLHVRVNDLQNAGVIVALGQDDVYDAYYPYGRCNMLEVAFLGSHLLWMMRPQDREVLYDMITVNPARIMRIPEYGLGAGKPADLVVLNAPDLREALAYHSEPLYVIKNGAVCCETRLNRISHHR